MNITLKQLRVFICISQEKTLTAAADKLCLSKPAVSMSLAELEKQLGHKLFERKNNRLLINEQGLALLPLADEQIERCQAITTLFSQKDSLSGKLRLGSSNTVGNHVIPALLADFRQQSGHQQQSLLIANSTTITQQLKAYDLDIALIEGNFIDNQLSIQRWIKDEMVVVACSGHPLANKSSIDLSELENLQWILREQGSGTRAFFLNHIGKQLHHYHIALELHTTEAIINCCAAGLGVTCISRLAARHALKDQRLVQLPLQLDMARDFYLAWHKEKYQSPLLKQFIAFTQQWQIPF